VLLVVFSALAWLAIMAASCLYGVPLDHHGAAVLVHPRVGENREYVAGQIIVRFRPGAARSVIAEAHRARKKDDMSSRAHRDPRGACR
jgi:hypothetical protein